MCRNVQQNYEAYRGIRTELANKEIEVSETSSAGSLLPRKLIALIREREKRANATRKYNQIGSQICRVRRATEDANNNAVTEFRMTGRQP